MQGFHGNTVSVYIKGPNAPSGAASLKANVWTRVVIDNFGPLDTQQHTGTIHNVVAARVKKDAFDSFGIACMGAREYLASLHPSSNYSRSVPFSRSRF
jgi:aldos-2-ulose dehydratase